MSGLQPNAVASSSTSTLVPPFSAMSIPAASPSSEAPSPLAALVAGPAIPPPLPPPPPPPAAVPAPPPAAASAPATAPAGPVDGPVDHAPVAAAAEDEPPSGPPLADLVDLYKRTHADFYAAYSPVLADARERAAFLLALAKPANAFHSALFDPDDDLLVIDSDTDTPGGAGRPDDAAFLGGGEHCTARRDALAVDYTLVSGRFGPKEWSSTKVSEPAWPEGIVDMEPPYVFARPVKRSIAMADEKVMTYYPTFSVVNEKKAPFDLQAYEQMFEEVEKADRPEAYPFIDCICYEYLNRVLLLHPEVDLKHIDRLAFLPLTTHEITHLPLHNDMLAFPSPNPSSDAFPPPPPPRLDGLNPRHARVDARWAAGESTFAGVLRDSEGMFCPLPSCGEYDCQIHTAHWENAASYVTPKDKGLPQPVSTMFLKVGKKACGPQCFTKRLSPKDQTSGRPFASILNDVVRAAPSWPDDEVEQLMVLVQTMPTLLPCQMVDIIADDRGMPKYSCYDYFLHRCKVMDLIEPRPSQTITVKRPKNGWPSKKPIDNSHHHMRPTRPCNHEGPCSVAQCECHVNKVHCTVFCHCSERECGRRFQGCKCNTKRGVLCQTERCPCFGAGRECDPLLCGNCGARDQDGGRCGNVVIQHARTKRVVVGPSAHGLGLFVAPGETIEKDEYILEYVGDVISENESARRGQIYEQGFRNYQFDLNFNQSVDAYRRGNDSRFINQPDPEFRRRDLTGEPGEANCYPKIVFVLGQHRIGLYALDTIEPGTELLFDYGSHFDPGAPAPPKASRPEPVYRDDDEYDYY